MAVLDFTYFRHYKIVANIPHIRRILACKPLRLMSIMNIVYYIASNYI